MSWQTWLVVAKEWQTAIGALLGFGGVMLTLSRNAAAVRHADDRRRLADANALRVALAEELRHMRDSAQGDIERIAAVVEGGLLLVPILDMSALFKASLDRLGLLGREEVAAVIKAHAFYSELERRLLLLGGQNRHLSGDEARLMRHVAVPADRASHMAVLVQHIAANADAALGKLESALSCRS
jgi:hypothetical protein